MRDIERTIRAYLNASSGTANHPTDHTILCFVGMIETGEADIELFRSIGGEWLAEKITNTKDEIDATRTK